MITKYRRLFLRAGKQPIKRPLPLEITVIYPLDKAFECYQSGHNHAEMKLMNYIKVWRRSNYRTNLIFFFAGRIGKRKIRAITYCDF